MSSLWDGVLIQVLDCTGPLMLNLSGTSSIFVIYLQSVTPEVNCSPLFIIESEVGMANEVV
jgi:hypothetical protein